MVVKFNILKQPVELLCYSDDWIDLPETGENRVRLAWAVFRKAWKSTYQGDPWNDFCDRFLSTNKERFKRGFRRNYDGMARLLQKFMEISISKPAEIRDVILAKARNVLGRDPRTFREAVNLRFRNKVRKEGGALAPSHHGAGRPLHPHSGHHGHRAGDQHRASTAGMHARVQPRHDLLPRSGWGGFPAPATAVQHQQHHVRPARSGWGGFGGPAAPLPHINQHRAAPSRAAPRLPR